MKRIKGFKLANAALAAALTLALSGCGDAAPNDLIDSPSVVVVPGTSVDEYILISSAGTASDIIENTTVGEWSTGSVINSDDTYEGLDAWSVTSAGSWGTVLAFTGGFAGDFSDFDTLSLKIATSGGYDDGYFIKISANGIESADIELSVDDGVTDWQDVEVDLSNYDLSSIEYIAIFAKTGTADVSKIYIADLSLDQQEDNDPDVPDTETDEYVLISSAGTASDIIENTTVGEWSTGSVIDAEDTYEGLDAWTITSGGSWGTVLAFTGGFDGDFSDFNKLKLKIATSGGYGDGYFIKIGAGGAESADIALDVDDTSTGWQDVEVDLSSLDLSSIEYIAVFAKTGTAGVSNIHITDLSLVQYEESDTGTGTIEGDEFSLVSSAGVLNEDIAETVIGEWSTGSVIDTDDTYKDLPAWTVTSAGSWGTVLAFTGGFVGDFSDFDTLSLKIATSGGYDDGYFIKIGTNGTESGDISLSVDDGVTGWQDVEVDLSSYDLSSIEYIAIFAKTGTAGVSKIYINDLELANTDTEEPTVEEAALEVIVSEAATFVEASYTTSTWAALTTALAMAETTQAEIIAKTAAITAATTALESKVVGAVDVTALSDAITAAEGSNLRQTGIGEAVGNASQADWETFWNAILAAAAIRDAAADQTAVDQAIVDLAAAEVVFNASKVAEIVIIEPIDDPDAELEEGPNLVLNGDFDDSTLSGGVGEWGYSTSTGTVVTIANSEMTAVVTSVGEGQWDNQIWNQISVTEEGDYVLRVTASSTVDRDILVRVDAIGMNGLGTTSVDSDVIAHLTSTPQVIELKVSGAYFTADAAFKLVMSLGELEASDTTSVASTVTFDDVYLGTLSVAVAADTNDLEIAVLTAQDLHDGGDDETLKAAYQLAIDAAQLVLDDEDATQTEADAALDALAEATAVFDPSVIIETGNLVVNGDFADSTVGTGADVGQWNYYTSTGTVVAIADGEMTAEVTELGGQWDNQISNEVQVTEEGAYVVKVTASSTVERDILIRIDGIGMANDGTLSTGSDVIAHLTTEPTEFTQYFNGTSFDNARFKIVMSVGELEAAGTTNVASTVTFHDVYLGTFTGDIPTDIATLSSAIASAQNLFDAAEEGTEDGQYTTSKDDLQAAIDAAQVVLDTADITQEQADAGVTALAAARAIFEAGLVVPAIAGAQISTSGDDINYTPNQWGTNTVTDLEYTGDATYSPSIQLIGAGGWGTTLGVTGLTEGILASYTSLDFKVKATTEFTNINVKVTGTENAYALADGTALTDDWIQMSIPMSDFGDAPASAVEFGIFGYGGTGTILLSELTLSE